jgi:hypothetical protein
MTVYSSWGYENVCDTVPGVYEQTAVEWEQMNQHSLSLPERIMRGALRSYSHLHVLLRQQGKRCNISLSTEFRVCAICTAAKRVLRSNEVRHGDILTSVRSK